MVDFFNMANMVYFLGWPRNIHKKSSLLIFLLVIGMFGTCSNASAFELSKDTLLNTQIDAKYLIKLGAEPELTKPIPPVIQNPVVNPVLHQDEAGLIQPVGWCPVMPIDPVNIHHDGNPVGEPINEVGDVKGDHGGGKPKNIVIKKPTYGDQNAVIDGLSALQKKIPPSVALTTHPKTHLSQVVAINGVSDRELSAQSFMAKAVNRDGIVPADMNTLTSVTIVLMQPETDELPMMENRLK